MKKTSTELKGRARESLLGNYTLPVTGLLLLLLATGALSWIVGTLVGLAGGSGFLSMLTQTAAGLILAALAYLGAAGYLRMLMNLCRGETYDFMDMLCAFTDGADAILLSVLWRILLGAACFLPALLLLFLSNLFPGQLWLRLLLLLVFLSCAVLCVAVELCYALTLYVCLDAPQLTAQEAMGTSRRLMRGQRLRLFYLEISFLGLALLSLLSLNIGQLWLTPYRECTLIEFYRDLNDEFE